MIQIEELIIYPGIDDRTGSDVTTAELTIEQYIKQLQEAGAIVIQDQGYITPKHYQIIGYIPAGWCPEVIINIKEQ